MPKKHPPTQARIYEPGLDFTRSEADNIKPDNANSVTIMIMPLNISKGVKN